MGLQCTVFGQKIHHIESFDNIMRDCFNVLYQMPTVTLCSQLHTTPNAYYAYRPGGRVRFRGFECLMNWCVIFVPDIEFVSLCGRFEWSEP